MAQSAPTEFEYYLNETEQPFAGWDFSHLTGTGRMREFPLRWNYYVHVRERLPVVRSLLDMGTGGGEFLASLAPLPADTVATEGYEPNIPIAAARLKPLGVPVVPVKDDERLALEDAQFELVINRHESYAPQEVARILKPGGTFLTQQVGGDNDCEINDWLGAPPFELADWRLEVAAEGLERAGLRIVFRDEERTKTRFYDIGAILYYLQAIPWQIPDFSVRKYEVPLREIHAHIRKRGYIDVTCSRFILTAVKVMA
ncbi:class I SAM-dependent methyltransferase [Paenibacillus ehimensis]|uniref:class I SAM-dependent methyltransferase n=1 Tax=Paenibacillus ehimensis TaxID=79264 RepID=UPI0004713A0F|nr:class I SAM-dependent methyltransferase [Paenibacillus ehimensis]